MEKKHIIVLIISAALLGQVVAMSLQYILILNPTNGLLWEPIKFANPPKYMKVKLPGLHSDVKVIYDNWGVPHIYGEYIEDVFRVFGYIQARDRLFQMDMFRRLIEGRLSEVFGNLTYDSDLFHRILGLKYAANASLYAIKQKFPDIFKYFEAFCDGVNYYIENGPLPLEFRLLGYKPEPWTPLNSLEIAKYIEWGLTGDFWDLERRVLVEKLGESRVEEIFPWINYELFPILRANETWYPSAKVAVWRDYSFKPYLVLPNDDLRDVVKLLNWIKKASMLDKYFAFRGSNNWVVGGKYTESGKPLLANDPHLALMVPPIWYEAHLVVYGKMNVRGVTFPGIPLIIIGRNDRVAWGMTNVGADVIDYYYYVWKDDETYYYNGSWVKVSYRYEIIKIKSGNGFVERRIRVNYTVHGPIFERGGARYAMRWVGHMATLEAVAIFKYDTAKTIDEFIEGLKLFNIPGQNIVYADRDGNIMYYPSALYPIRKNLKTGEYVAGNMPFNGSNLEGEWVGFIPFDEIPHAINLPRGYIVTANNRPDAGTLPYYWGDSENFADPYRAMRITQLILDAINSKGYVTIDDFKRIQGDSYSIPASIFVPILLDALKDVPLSDIERAARDILANWNYYMFSNLSAPTIYAKWLYLYREYIFEDEYEINGISGVRKPKVSTIQYMTEHPDQFKFWFDDKRTDAVETWKDIMVKAFKDAVKWLKERFKDDNPENWIYGKIHMRKLDHPLGSVLTWLNYKAVPDHGSWFTVDPAGFDPSQDYWYSSGGASWREIIDMSNPDNSLCIIPGGQSGNPYSKHYDDQYWLWLRTEYKQMITPPTPEDFPKEKIEGVIDFIAG